MTDLQTYLTAAVTALVGLFAVWLVRKIARAMRLLSQTLGTELHEIARIPDEVSGLVSAVAQLVTELRAVKSRIDRLETAFGLLDLAPDHVTMHLRAHPRDRERGDTERQETPG